MWFEDSNSPFHSTPSKNAHCPVMEKRPPYLFFKRLVLVCSLTKPILRTMASGKTVHSAGINEVHQVPINVINRPIVPELDEEKVKSLMKTIKVGAYHQKIKSWLWLTFEPLKGYQTWPFKLKYSLYIITFRDIAGSVPYNLVGHEMHVLSCVRPGVKYYLQVIPTFQLIV